MASDIRFHRTTPNVARGKKEQMQLVDSFYSHPILVGISFLQWKTQHIARTHFDRTSNNRLPAVALHEIDSIMNSGRLVHRDVYEIGRLKNISISVQKLTAGEEATVWINFRKDCGGEYKQNSTVTLSDKDAEDLKILIQKRAVEN